MPELEQMHRLAKFLGVRPKTLSDAAMDDLAAAAKAKIRPSVPKLPESRSPNKPVNSW
ncbi:hypothetical protein [Xanthomonas phage RTH11]|nr:hypothetical protein [Xanthomonas phage RTH11]